MRRYNRQGNQVSMCIQDAAGSPYYPGQRCSGLPNQHSAHSGVEEKVILGAGLVGSQAPAYVATLVCAPSIGLEGLYAEVFAT